MDVKTAPVPLAAMRGVGIDHASAIGAVRVSYRQPAMIPALARGIALAARFSFAKSQGRGVGRRPAAAFAAAAPEAVTEVIGGGQVSEADTLDDDSMVHGCRPDFLS